MQVVYLTNIRDKGCNQDRENSFNSLCFKVTILNLMRTLLSTLLPDLKRAIRPTGMYSAIIFLID